MLPIIKAHAVNNLCYINAQKMKPKGIVVHSTGACNPYLKRYVDSPNEVGPNIYNNHWNTPRPGGREVCVHAFVGYDKNLQIRVAEILPLDICCWGVGHGSKGSYNNDPAYIQFEICEDELSDEKYYQAAFSVAAEYCAQLCEAYGFGVDVIVGHCEAYRLGYGSNHSDPEHWMKRFGETMDDFRKQVSEILDKIKTTAKNPGELDFGNNRILSVSKGDLVSIADNATYYDGKTIPAWVRKQNWYVKETPSGDRVVIDQNEQGTHCICSPINQSFLTVVKPFQNRISNIEKQATESPCPYLVKIAVDSLPIHKGAGSNYSNTGHIKDKGVYTIVEEANGHGASKWGKLKSGVGWISLDLVKKI